MKTTSVGYERDALATAYRAEKKRIRCAGMGKMGARGIMRVCFCCVLCSHEDGFGAHGEFGDCSRGD